MLTLNHVKEVIERALSHVKQQQGQAQKQAEMDQHQYNGAAEGIRFLGSLLEEKHSELVKGATDGTGGKGDAAAAPGVAPEAGSAGSPAPDTQVPSAPPAAG